MLKKGQSQLQVEAHILIRPTVAVAARTLDIRRFASLLVTRCGCDRGSDKKSETPRFVIASRQLQTLLRQATFLNVSKLTKNAATHLKRHNFQ